MLTQERDSPNSIDDKIIAAKFQIKRELNVFEEATQKYLDEIKNLAAIEEFKNHFEKIYESSLEILTKITEGTPANIDEELYKKFRTQIFVSIIKKYNL